MLVLEIEAPVPEIYTEKPYSPGSLGE